VSSNSVCTLENAGCVLLLVHQTRNALNKLKFMKHVILLRVNFSHKLYLISAFVGLCTNYTNVYGKDNKMLLCLVWEIKWPISFRVKFALCYENCLQKSHNFSV
jgi:hypothetical protein